MKDNNAFKFIEKLDNLFQFNPNINNFLNCKTYFDNFF